MVTVPTITPPPLTNTATAGGDSPDFDERWAAWLAKGAAHDRATRRKMAFAVPIVVIVTAVVMYAFFGQ
jgi:small-conductance mechanosensitive channel